MILKQSGIAILMADNIALFHRDEQFENGFPGFLCPDSRYQFLEIRDWDTCLLGRENAVYEAPAWKVDGHYRLRANGAGTCTVIESTGNYENRIPVGETGSIDDYYPQKTRKIISDTRAELNTDCHGSINAVLSNCENMWPHDWPRLYPPESDVSVQSVAASSLSMLRTAAAATPSTACRYAEDTGEKAFPAAPCRGNRIICHRIEGHTSYTKACTPEKCKFYEEG